MTAPFFASKMKSSGQVKAVVVVGDCNRRHGHCGAHLGLEIASAKTAPFTVCAGVLGHAWEVLPNVLEPGRAEPSITSFTRQTA